MTTPKKKAAAAKKKKAALVAKKPRRRAVKVTSSVAVLAALADGKTTIKTIAKAARMTDSAVQQTLGRLRRKDPAQVKRTNKRGVGVVGQFKITASGRKVLRAAMKELDG